MSTSNTIKEQLDYIFNDRRNSIHQKYSKILNIMETHLKNPIFNQDKILQKIFDYKKFDINQLYFNNCDKTTILHQIMFKKLPNIANIVNCFLNNDNLQFIICKYSYIRNIFDIECAKEDKINLIKKCISHQNFNCNLNFDYEKNKYKHVYFRSFFLNYNLLDKDSFYEIITSYINHPDFNPNLDSENDNLYIFEIFNHTNVPKEISIQICKEYIELKNFNPYFTNAKDKDIIQILLNSKSLHLKSILEIILLKFIINPLNLLTRYVNNQKELFDCIKLTKL
jgi:hypothetical protein